MENGEGHDLSDISFSIFHLSFSIPLPRDPFKSASWLVFALSALVGLASFGYYYSHGLTTAHYDAKAHLVLARGVLDSTHPGYGQIGAHWLPLTHLLYLPFVS